MNNREYDLEVVPVNFERPSFGLCALLLGVHGKVPFSSFSRWVRGISQYSYRTMSQACSDCCLTDRTGHLSVPHGFLESPQLSGDKQKSSQSKQLYPIGPQLRLWYINGCHRKYKTDYLPWNERADSPQPYTLLAVERICLLPLLSDHTRKIHLASLFILLSTTMSEIGYIRQNKAKRYKQIYHLADLGHTVTHQTLHK